MQYAGARVATVYHQIIQTKTPAASAASSHHSAATTTTTKKKEAEVIITEFVYKRTRQNHSHTANSL